MMSVYSTKSIVVSLGAIQGHSPYFTLAQNMFRRNFGIVEVNTREIYYRCSKFNNRALINKWSVLRDWSIVRVQLAVHYLSNRTLAFLRHTE